MGGRGCRKRSATPKTTTGSSCLLPAINWSRFLPCDIWPQLVMLEARNFVSTAKLPCRNGSVGAGLG